MGRIRFTGYLDVEDLEPGEHDPEDSTGLTEAAHLRYCAGEGLGILLHTLEDLEATYVEEN